MSIDRTAPSSSDKAEAMIIKDWPSLALDRMELQAPTAGDAELLFLWAEWKTIRRAMAETNDDAVVLSLYSLLDPLEDGLRTIPASTPAGLACKLSVALAYSEAPTLDELAGYGARDALLVVAYRDAMRVAGLHEPEGTAFPA